jgi:hypothetical protein
MNLENARRNELSGIPFLNNAFDWLISRINLVFRAQHTDDGAHTAITATSVTVEEDVDIAGELLLRNDGDGDDVTVRSTRLGPDTLEPGDGSITADVSVDVLQLDRTLVPAVDGTLDLGLYGSGVLERRFRRGAFSEFVAAETGYYERGRFSALSVWTPITFAAGNFTGNAAAWTVVLANQVSFCQKRQGTSVTVNFSIQNTNVTAGSSQLRIAVPTTLVAGGRFTNAVARAVDAGTVVPARVVIDASVSATLLLILKSDGTNWTATAGNDTLVEGQIEYESAS